MTSSVVIAALIEQPTTGRENNDCRGDVEPAFRDPDLGEGSHPAAIGVWCFDSAAQHIWYDGARLRLP